MTAGIHIPTLSHQQAKAEAERRRRIRERNAATATMPQWAQYYRRIDDKPFSLARFVPLETIYADQSPHIVIIKPAQRGVSEYAINLACFALDRGAEVWETDKNGLNVGYLFPTLGALQDFAKERFSGLKDESAGLRALFGSGEFDAVTFKQVGKSYLYLRGAWSESSLLSFACDLLILDEFDRMDPKAIAMGRKRLNASVLQREVDLSTPTVPGAGIHAAYLASDQHIWENYCAGCEGWHQLDFFRDVRANDQPWDIWQYWSSPQVAAATMHVACPGCRAPIDRCGPGRWRALCPEITITRGYWIPPLAFPFVRLERLAQNAIKIDPNEVEEFYRSDLGLPYEPKGSRVTSMMLDQLSAALPGGQLPDRVPWRDTTMGIDVGAHFHYRVSSLDASGARVVRAMGRASTWGELSDLMNTYRVRQCVIDAMPELHGASDWAAAHPGRVLRAFYQETPDAQLWTLGMDGGALDGTIRIFRTLAMDGVYATVARAREHWPLAIVQNAEVRAHMQAPIRVTTPNAKTGQPTPVWVHTSPDHLYHACVYDNVAASLVDALNKALEDETVEVYDERVDISLL